MKRIIYFVLAILVCGIYAGCSESEICLLYTSDAADE